MSRGRAPFRASPPLGRGAPERRCARGTLLLAATGLLAACGPAQAERLFLLLTEDTLRADQLGAYGSGLGATPHLDRLLAQSLRFEDAFAPCSYTLPSVAAMMTGRHPEALGAPSSSASVEGRRPALAARLRDAGFATGAVASNDVLRRESGLAEGFASYDDAFPQSERSRDVPDRRAARTTDAGLRMLDRLARTERASAFLWVHYQDLHGPYVPDDALRARFRAEAGAGDADPRALPVAPGERGVGSIPRYQHLEGHRDPAFYRAGYAGEVALVDDAVGRLLDRLRERGLWQKSTVLFTTDHGEGLGEQDYWFAHGELLTDPLVRDDVRAESVHRTGSPDEDLASRRPDLLARMRGTFERLRSGLEPAQDAPRQDLSAEAIERLWSLGYLEGPADSSDPAPRDAR